MPENDGSGQQLGLEWKSCVRTQYKGEGEKAFIWQRDHLVTG